jgi:two-component system sensor histidine kinase DesK
VQPVFDHFTLRQYLIQAAGFIVFLVLYFGLFVFEKPRGLYYVAGMLLLGMFYLPFNGGACTFFIFAAAFVPFAVQTQKRAIAGLLTIVAIAGSECLLLHISGWGLFYAAVFPLFVGGSNIFFAERNRMNRRLTKANEEIEHLAKVAERERIARDLHDVLGHTLSVIILKSELAGKLMDRNPQQAGAEIREVEQISRKALSDVRDAIRGYRSQGLIAELAQAKSTLETAGVTVHCDAGSTMKLLAVQESVLSMAVREAVTNVLRHAKAHTCSLRLEQRNGNCQLEIQDDGCGGANVEGNGLRGMRERVEMLGGKLSRETASGNRLTIILPLKEFTPKEEGCTN